MKSTRKVNAFDIKPLIRKPNRIKPIAFALLAFVSQASQAQQTASAEPQTVTITGSAAREDTSSRSPRNPHRTTESSVNHEQIIGREEIERLRPRDLFELLNAATGVVATQGSRKGFSGLTIRGDSNFRWIVDGAMLQPTMAARIVKAIPVMAIEQVRVIRGGSALGLGPMTGSASPGGAPVDGFVIVSTRKPARLERQVRLAVESFDTVLADAWIGTRFDGDGYKAYVAGALSRADTNGPSDLLDNGAPYNLARENSARLAKAGLEIAGWGLDLMLYQDDGMFQIPNANSHGAGQGSWYMDPSRSRMASLSGSRSWSRTQTTTFGLNHTESRQTFWTATSSSGPFNSVQNDNIQTQLYLRHVADFGNTRLSGSLDQVHWDAPNGQQYYEGIRREERTTGWSLQAEHTLTPSLALDASLRRDRVFVLHGLDYYIGGAQPPGGVNTPLRYRDRQLLPATFLSLGALYEVLNGWNLATRFTQGRQDVQSGLNPAPGVTFDADEQMKWELGLEGRTVGWLTPSINWFHREVKNEKSVAGYSYTATNKSSQTCRAGPIPSTGPLSLAAAQIPLPCYSQADTLREGIELSVVINPRPETNLRASVTQFTELSEVAKSTTPRTVADLSFGHSVGKFLMSGVLKHVSRYKGSSTDTTAWLGGYTRIDLGLGYQFSLAGAASRITVYGRNLSDKRYETTNGVQDAGRTLGIELTTAF